MNFFIFVPACSVKEDVRRMRLEAVHLEIKPYFLEESQMTPFINVTWAVEPICKFYRSLFLYLDVLIFVFSFLTAKPVFIFLQRLTW